MKKAILFLSIAVCLAACKSSRVEGWSTSDLRYIPLECNNEDYVYVDTETGEQVMWGQFDYATLFYDGFAIIARPDDGYRFSRKGDLGSLNSYYDITIFHDGIAWAVNSGGPITAIDRKGNKLFEFKQAEIACAFHDGVAAFCDADGLWGLVDKKGHVVVEPCWADVVPMVVNGMIAVKYADTGWCLADKTGKTVSDFYKQVGTKKYDEDFKTNYVQALAEGRIPVQDKKGKWGIIDRAGRSIISPQFHRLLLDGKNYIFNKGGEWGWCDEKGHYLINPQFSSVGPFADNDLASAMNYEGRWGYIDKKGNWVINPQFRKAEPFMPSGIALVQEANSYDYGAIDKTGKWVINPQFQKMLNYGYKDRIIVIDQSDHLGIIDTKGEYVLMPKYTNAPMELLTNVSGFGAKYKVQSAYVDVEAYAKRIDERIHTIKSATVQELMNTFGLQQGRFPKGGGKVTVCQENAMPDMKFKITTTEINAWNKTSDGWFGYNYTFRPEVRVDSYTFTVEFDDEGKANRFVDEIFEAVRSKYPNTGDLNSLAVPGYKSVSIGKTQYGSIVIDVQPE